MSTSTALTALERAVAKAAKPEAEQLSPSAAWLALTTIPRPSQRVPLPRKMPGTDKPCGYVLLWPLTQEEQMAASAEADRYTKALLKDPQREGEANLGYHHSYTNELAIQVLYRAARDPDDEKRPAFPSPGLMRQALTTDETGVLFANYCTVQSELGPIRAQMLPEESDALILRLAEGGSTFPLDSYSWEQQRILLASMASRLASCWTVMSSAGLQPDVTTYVLQLLVERRAAAEQAAVATVSEDDEGEGDASSDEPEFLPDPANDKPEPE